MKCPKCGKDLKCAECGEKVDTDVLFQGPTTTRVCPFTTRPLSYAIKGQGSSGAHLQRVHCIEAECMAWDVTPGACKLIEWRTP